MIFHTIHDQFSINQRIVKFILTRIIVAMGDRLESVEGKRIESDDPHWGSSRSHCHENYYWIIENWTDLFGSPYETGFLHLIILRFHPLIDRWRSAVLSKLRARRDCSLNPALIGLKRDSQLSAFPYHMSILTPLSSDQMFNWLTWPEETISLVSWSLYIHFLTVPESVKSRLIIFMSPSGNVPPKSG
jgi:hypothetical protein